jgi:hypothetical protein
MGFRYHTGGPEPDRQNAPVQSVTYIKAFDHIRDVFADAWRDARI